MKKITVALLYDFDKTLCDRDMQEYTFIPSLGLTPAQFWGKADDISVHDGMERILSYLYLMVTECKEKNIKLTREYLNSCAKNIRFYKGVTTWFKRINEFGASLGLNVEHYVISSGCTEIIEGSSIAKEFKKVYGCQFHYNKEGIADFPLNTINYTMKTQYIHRISKGVLDINDDANLNAKMARSDRHVQFKNMIYFGDGLTDVPSMKMVQESGGKAIALFTPTKMGNASSLILEGRADFITKNDYSEGSELETIVKLILERISLDYSLEQKYNQMVKKAKNALN